MAGRRYIVKSAHLTFGTLGGALEQELWLGFEIDGPVNLEILSRCGYDLIPADGMTEEELLSVGVTTFDQIVVPVDAEADS
jgi:hypothetical protein